MLNTVQKIAAQGLKGAACVGAAHCAAVGTAFLVGATAKIAEAILSLIPGFQSTLNFTHKWTLGLIQFYKFRESLLIMGPIALGSKVKQPKESETATTKSETTPELYLDYSKTCLVGITHLTFAAFLLYGVQKVTAPSFGISLQVRNIQLLNL